jgi:hypothetical protein
VKWFDLRNETTSASRDVTLLYPAYQRQAERAHEKPILADWWPFGGFVPPAAVFAKILGLVEDDFAVPDTTQVLSWKTDPYLKHITGMAKALADFADDARNDEACSQADCDLYDVASEVMTHRILTQAVMDRFLHRMASIEEQMERQQEGDGS